MQATRLGARASPGWRGDVKHYPACKTLGGGPCKDEHHKNHIHKSRSSFMIHIKHMNHGFTYMIHDDFMMIYDLFKVIFGYHN